MNTSNTIMESKDQLIEKLQSEIKRLRNLHAEAPQMPPARFIDEAKLLKDVAEWSRLPELKYDTSYFRRSVEDASYSLPTAEAIPVIDGEAIRQESMAIQELQKENLRLQAQLAAAAKERETFVFLQEENKRLQTENLRLHQKVEKKSHTADQISKKYMDLYFQYNQEKKARETLLRTEIQPALSAIEERIDRMTDLAIENGNLLLNTKTKPLCEDKAVQAFSESAIAEELLKSQPKRLRYLK